MKKITNNSFSKLNTDATELRVENTDMTNAVNATTFTREDNQFILQNLKGNEAVAGLKEGYIPMGIATFRNIAYIVSALFDANMGFIRGEIGTYPSPDWTTFHAPGYNGSFLPLKQEYSPLRNFSISTDENILNNASNYTQEFNTDRLNFVFNKLAQVKIQPSFDNSVNIVINDTVNPVRLINSRFKVDANGVTAALAERKGQKDTNVYSEKRFNNTKLFKQSDVIPDLTFLGLTNGGYWKPGGYKFYFKYADIDGNLTDIIEESGLVTIAEDTYGVQTEQVAKAINFTIRNLDPKFAFLKVYYSYTAGNDAPASIAKEIALTYSLPEVVNGLTTFDLVLYGNEAAFDISDLEINANYSAIRTVAAIEQHQNNFMMAHATFNINDSNVLEAASAQLLLEEDLIDLNIKDADKGYRNPVNNYYRVGYWERETYELCIVYILKNGEGLSLAYPVRGRDNIANTHTYGTYTTDELFNSNIFDPTGFKADNFNENRRGVYRTGRHKKLLKNGNTTEVLHFTVDLTPVLTNSQVQALTDGFFFVRRERIKDAVVQGIICNTAQVPIRQELAGLRLDENGEEVVKFNRLNAAMNEGSPTGDPLNKQLVDIRSGIGLEENTTKIIPAPGRLFAVNHDGGWNRILNLQGQVRPDPLLKKPDKFSFYSSDELVFPSLYQTIFQGEEYAIHYMDTPTIVKEDITPGLPNMGLSKVNYLGITPDQAEWGNINAFKWLWIHRLAELIYYGSNLWVGECELRFAVDSTQILVIKAKITINGVGVNNAQLVVTQGQINIIGTNYWLNGDDGVTPASVWNPFNFSLTVDTTTLPPVSVTPGDPLVILSSTPINLNLVGALSGPFVYNAITANLPFPVTTYGRRPTITAYLSTPQATPSTEALSELQLESLETIHENFAVGEFYYTNETKDGYSNQSFSTKLDRNIYYKGKQSPADGKKVAFLAADGVQYSSYTGIKVLTGKDRLCELLQNDVSTVFNYSAEDIGNGNPNDEAKPLLNRLNNGSGMTHQTDTQDYTERIEILGIRFGVPANIYKTKTGMLPAGGAWRNKYAHAQDRVYFAITKRYKWADVAAPNNPRIRIFGGDCYIDYTMKRFMYGLGIPGVLTASDPSAYTKDNQDAGLMRKGIVFPLVNESNYNSALRSREVVSNLEQGVYGKKRSFILSGEFSEEYRANRQWEAKAYNFGYNYDYNIRIHPGLNPLNPVNSINYPNRLFVSEKDTTIDFVNSFSRFFGFNFRDYNTELGAIYNLISHNDRLYAVHENGIIQVPINERNMITSDKGGILIENSEVLGRYAQVISDKYGGVVAQSMGSTAQGIYGYDPNRNVIWMVRGRDFKLLSDFTIRKLLEQYQYKLMTWGSDKEVTLTDYLVKFNYNLVQQQVMFTFLSAVTREAGIAQKGYYAGLDPNMVHLLFKYDKLNVFQPETRLLSTVVYSEIDSVWKSQLSINPLFGFNLRDDFYSFSALRTRLGQDIRNNIYKHESDNVPYCFMYEEQEKFVFEFLIIDNPAQQKILENLTLITNRAFPGRCTYFVEDYYKYNDGVSLLPNLQTGDPENNDVATVDLLKQRYELVNYQPGNFQLLGGQVYLTGVQSLEEAERTKNGYFIENGITYVLGGPSGSNTPNTLVFTQVFQINALTGALEPATILPSFPVTLLQFGILQQNQEYIENELFIEVGKNINNTVIRDKVIKVQIMYEGRDYVQVHAVLSKIIYSYG